MMRTRAIRALSALNTCRFFLVAALLLNIAAATASADVLSAVLANHPVAYWRLDEPAGDFISVVSAAHAGSDAGHLVTRGINGPQPPVFPGFESANKGISASNTPGNGAAVNYVSAAHDAALNIGLSDWSIEAWVYLAATQGTGEGYIVSKMDGSRNGYGLSLSASNTPTVTFRKASGYGGYSNEVVTVGAPAALTLNSWHHLVGTIARNATDTQDRVTLYVDGVQANTILSDKVFNWSMDPTVGNLTIGSLGSTFGFKGSIDEVAVYRAALTAGQVKAHYDAAFFVPEPASLLLAGSGILMGFLARGRRKRK